MPNTYNKRYFHNRVGVLDKNREIVEKERLNILKQYIFNKETIRILDIGCGFGYFLKFCDEEGWQTFGVDHSDYALSKAKNYTKAELFLIDLNKEKLPFENNFFDAIVAIDFIEHLISDTIFLDEANRILRKNGIFFLLTPNGHSRYDRDLTHINIYEEKDLINRLNNNNFKILNIHGAKGYTERMTPLRRYPFINKFNQRICDIFGKYVKEVIVIATK